MSKKGNIFAPVFLTKQKNTTTHHLIQVYFNCCYCARLGRLHGERYDDGSGPQTHGGEQFLRGGGRSARQPQHPPHRTGVHRRTLSGRHHRVRQEGQRSR